MTGAGGIKSGEQEEAENDGNETGGKDVRVTRVRRQSCKIFQGRTLRRVRDARPSDFY